MHSSNQDVFENLKVFGVMFLPMNVAHNFTWWNLDQGIWCEPWGRTVEDDIYHFIHANQTIEVLLSLPKGISSIGCNNWAEEEIEQLDEITKRREETVATKETWGKNCK